MSEIVKLDHEMSTDLFWMEKIGLSIFLDCIGGKDLLKILDRTVHTALDTDYNFVQFRWFSGILSTTLSCNSL